MNNIWKHRLNITDTVTLLVLIKWKCSYRLSLIHTFTSASISQMEILALFSCALCRRSVTRKRSVTRSLWVKAAHVRVHDLLWALAYVTVYSAARHPSALCLRASAIAWGFCHHEIMRRLSQAIVPCQHPIDTGRHSRSALRRSFQRFFGFQVGHVPETFVTQFECFHLNKIYNRKKYKIRKES